MPSTPKALVAAILSIWFSGVGAMTAEGLVTVPSSFGPKDTMERFEAAVKAKGLTVFARIDHAAGAAAVGMPLRPTELLVFGNAKGGTPLMQANQATGIGPGKVPDAAIEPLRDASMQPAQSSHKYRLDMQPPRVFPGGREFIVSSKEFPIQTTLTAACRQRVLGPALEHRLPRSNASLPVPPAHGTARTALALVAGFVFSGLVHELVISVPARAGYGGPTLFFALQVPALLFERSRTGKALGLGQGVRGWLLTVLVIVGPAGMLFHPPFDAQCRPAVPASDRRGVKEKDMRSDLIFAAGFLQLSVLIASSLVPLRLNWKRVFQSLPRLHRQMYWVYGGYVVLAIVAQGLVCIVNSAELAAGSSLARGVCGYIAVFWGVRLSLQAVLDVKEYLTTWWLKLGYHTLTLLFASFTVLFAWAAIG